MVVTGEEQEPRGSRRLNVSQLLVAGILESWMVRIGLEAPGS